MQVLERNKTSYPELLRALTDNNDTVPKSGTYSAFTISNKLQLSWKLIDPDPVARQFVPFATLMGIGWAKIEKLARLADYQSGGARLQNQ